MKIIKEPQLNQAAVICAEKGGIYWISMTPTTQQMVDDINKALRDERIYLPVPLCKKGNVYRVEARNFSIAMFDGKDGFIGIRQKFGDEFLFTEQHWDAGPPNGTVMPLYELTVTNLGTNDLKFPSKDDEELITQILKETEKQHALV